MLMLPAGSGVACLCRARGSGGARGPTVFLSCMPLSIVCPFAHPSIDCASGGSALHHVVLPRRHGRRGLKSSRLLRFAGGPGLFGRWCGSWSPPAHRATCQALPECDTNRPERGYGCEMPETRTRTSGLVTKVAGPAHPQRPGKFGHAPTGRAPPSEPLLGGQRHETKAGATGRETRCRW